MLVAHGAELTLGHESLAKLGMIDAGPSLHRCCVVVCVAVRRREDGKSFIYIWRSILDSVCLLRTAIARPRVMCPKSGKVAGPECAGWWPLHRVKDASPEMTFMTEIVSATWIIRAAVHQFPGSLINPNC